MGPPARRRSSDAHIQELSGGAKLHAAVRQVRSDFAGGSWQLFDCRHAYIQIGRHYSYSCAEMSQLEDCVADVQLHICFSTIPQYSSFPPILYFIFRYLCPRLCPPLVLLLLPLPLLLLLLGGRCTRGHCSCHRDARTVTGKVELFFLVQSYLYAPVLCAPLT